MDVNTFSIDETSDPVKISLVQCEECVFECVFFFFFSKNFTVGEIRIGSVSQWVKKNHPSFIMYGIKHGGVCVCVCVLL